MEPAPFFDSPEILPEELRDLGRLPGAAAVRLVDVREPDEFAICRIGGAELIPLGRLLEEAPCRIPDRDQPVVLYCHHGIRSAHALMQLRRLGYRNLCHLAGGIAAWAERVEPDMERY